LIVWYHLREPINKPVTVSADCWHCNYCWLLQS